MDAEEVLFFWKMTLAWLPGTAAGQQDQNVRISMNATEKK